MLRLLAMLIGDGCPSCDGDVVGGSGRTARQAAAHIDEEADHHVCRRCGVVVVYDRGGWRFPLESSLRPLPGVMGIPFRMAEWRKARRPAA